MDWLTIFELDKFLLFTLVFTRVTGLMMTAPIYGTSDIPMQTRALFSFAVALLITAAQWHVGIAYPGTTINYLVFIGSELLIGMSLGLGIVILFSGIHLAGQMIGRISGLMLADVFDPGLGTSVPVFSRLMYMLTLAVFVTIGGHRMVMAALLDTFNTIPPGSGTVAISTYEAFELILTESFELAIRASAPVVTALLLSTLVMGLIGRTLPQLNILAVGFGLNSMLMFGTLSLVIGAAVWIFQDEVGPALQLVLDALVDSR
jgi:flagellar biosynthetic protein FliR